MKRILQLVFVLSLFTSLNTTAQLAENSWALGFGLSYPKLTSTNTGMLNSNYGGYLSIQRNFIEQAGIRFLTKYSHLEGTFNTGAEKTITNSIYGSFDLIYYFIPCGTFSPYMAAGLGFDSFSLINPDDPDYDGSFLELIFNVGVGFEASFNQKWKLSTELGIHSVANSGFDGRYGSAGYGLIGANTDAFMSFNIGAQYYFSRGAPSKRCNLYDGIGTVPDSVVYARIDSLIVKRLPKEIVKEVVVQAPTEAQEITPTGKEWILVTVDFDFSSARLKQDAYPGLYYTSQVLAQNPDMVIVIKGYADENEQSNNSFSLFQKRADAIKGYLLSLGMDARRVKEYKFGTKDSKTITTSDKNKIEISILN
ncbi:MAG: OmpA family protein [Bacteroidota bacterium]